MSSKRVTDAVRICHVPTQPGQKVMLVNSVFDVRDVLVAVQMLVPSGHPDLWLNNIPLQLQALNR